MHLTEHIRITLEGMGSIPQTFMVPPKVGKEIKSLIAKNEKRVTKIKKSEDFVPVEEVFPYWNDPIKRASHVLRGTRYRREMTQKELAEKLGIRQHHLSEMEHAKRPIGKQMAKKLAKVLRVDYRLFL